MCQDKRCPKCLWLNRLAVFRVHQREAYRFVAVPIYSLDLEIEESKDCEADSLELES